MTTFMLYLILVDRVYHLCTTSHLETYPAKVWSKSLDLHHQHRENQIYLELNKKCVKKVQIGSFFWSVFSRIWTEYGDLLCKSRFTFYAVKEQKSEVYSESCQTSMTEIFDKVLSTLLKVYSGWNGKCSVKIYYWCLI